MSTVQSNIKMVYYWLFVAFCVRSHV